MKTKALYRFIEFVRPDGYWPYPYTTEQAFGVLGWMLDTGEAYRDATRWGHQSVLSLLSCKPTCVNFSEMDPITSLADLKRRFHYAILSGYAGPELQSWRGKYSIAPGGEAIIHFPHHKYGSADQSEASIEAGLDALLKASGLLSIQLNEYHKEAKEIYGVYLRHRRSPGEKRGTWCFELQYGCDGSVWRKNLAEQSTSETFLAAFKRAKAKLGELTAPAAKENLNEGAAS